MRTKKFLAMAIALGLAVGMTAMLTKRPSYLVIPPLMRKMRRQILILRIPMQDGLASVME